MTTPNVDNTKTEYIKIQVPFANGSMPVYINSAFTTPQTYTVQDGNSVGEKLASGDVNQPENVAETNGTEPFEQVKNTQPAEKSTQDFYGYSIDDLKKYLEPTCNINKLSPDMLIDKANEVLESEIKTLKSPGFLTDTQWQLFNKIFPDEDGIQKAIIESYFNAYTVCKVICDIEAENDISSLEPENLHDIYRKKSRACNEFCQNSAISPEIRTLMETLNGKSLGEKTAIIKKYLSDVCLEKVANDFCGPRNYDFENADEKILNAFREIQTAIAPDDNETRKALLAAICTLSEEEHLNVLQQLLDDCRDDKEKAELLASMDTDILAKCSKEMFFYIVDQYKSNGIIGQLMAEKGVTPEAISRIHDALAAAQNGSPFELDEELTEIFEIYKEVISGLANATAAAGVRDDLTQEEQEEIGNTIDDIGNTIGEDGIRDLWTKVHEIFEQHPKIFENISLEQFEENMNQMSHGNYNTVVQDILRGDGVQTPLNMPESTASGSYNYGSSAQNPETGFFNTQPQSVINYSQNNLAELKQSLVQSTASDTTPQLVKNESAQNIIQKGGDKKASLLTKYRQKIGNLSFIKEIFNNNVNFKDNLAVTMALNSFENIGKSMRLITFERINNSTGASLVMKEMSTDEKSEVHAQNIYIAEKLKQQVEEEEKKKQA